MAKENQSHARPPCPFMHLHRSHSMRNVLEHSRCRPCSRDGSGRGQESCRSRSPQPVCGKAAQPQPQPQPCTCQGTPTQAHRGQELPSLSVDSEMEFAILNRAKVHRHVQWHGLMKCSCKAPPSLPHSLSFPPQLWIEAFYMAAAA